MATLQIVVDHQQPAAEPMEAPLALYALDENLASLIDTEPTVSEEDRAEFAQRFQRAILASPDNVGRALAFLEAQIDLAKREVTRIEHRGAEMESLHDNLTAHSIGAIKALGPGKGGKYPKVEGQFFTLGIKANPESVNVKDAESLPDSCKKVTVAMQMPLWNKVLDSLEFELRAKVLEEVKRQSVEISKSAVKDAIAAGEQITGAEMVRTYRLEVK